MVWDRRVQPLTFSLSHPQQTANGVASREEEEISELQEDDRDQFSDQLASVGMLGRIAAEHCMPLLTRYTLPQRPMAQTCHRARDFKHPHLAHWSKRTDKLLVAFLSLYIGAKALQHRWQTGYGKHWITHD